MLHEDLSCSGSRETFGVHRRFILSLIHTTRRNRSYSLHTGHLNTLSPIELRVRKKRFLWITLDFQGAYFKGSTGKGMDYAQKPIPPRRLSSTLLSTDIQDVSCRLEWRAARASAGSIRRRRTLFAAGCFCLLKSRRMMMIYICIYIYVEIYIYICIYRWVDNIFYSLHCSSFFGFMFRILN